jgi:hypothetical protein
LFEELIKYVPVGTNAIPIPTNEITVIPQMHQQKALLTDHKEYDNCSERRYDELPGLQLLLSEGPICMRRYITVI